MTTKRKKYSREFKLRVIRERETGKSLGELSRKYEIHPTLVTRWKKEYRENPEEAFKGNGNIYKHEARIAELERRIGQLHMENEFLKKTTAFYEKRLQEVRRKERGG